MLNRGTPHHSGSYVLEAVNRYGKAPSAPIHLQLAGNGFISKSNLLNVCLFICSQLYMQNRLLYNDKNQYKMYN